VTPVRWYGPVYRGPAVGVYAGPRYYAPYRPFAGVYVAPRYYGPYVYPGPYPAYPYGYGYAPRRFYYPGPAVTFGYPD